ncbi:MAG: sigma 54-interacting transcriptional regulator [Gammaproteobacteria bacterium]|jgi:two-component system response regulator GlrR
MANPKVLIVDDDIGILQLISIRLEAMGYAVTAVESAEEALASMSVVRPDIVVTDLRMEGMDGLALFDAIHESNPALPVIILTAHGTIPEAVDATKRGVFSFLSKPFDGRALVEHINKALALSGKKEDDGEEDSSWRSAIITRSPAMEDILSQAKLIAQSEVSVFLHGASGSGKELFANAIHKASPRRDKPFVAINCSAIPEALLESELFGHRKGSFTGATKDHEGLFLAAGGGTLFLDEIGDMPLALQAKLLRVLQESMVRPVGSTESISVDVRVISATHKDLDQSMEKGEFREDLYYRLNVVSIEIPSLHERREDIPLLTQHFLKDISDKSNKKITSFSSEAMELLVAAPWPGNVRQLLNVVEQVVALSTTPVIPATLVRKALKNPSPDILTYSEAKLRFERDYLCHLLQITSGKVSQAAKLAKRNRTEFYRLLNRHNIDPGLFKKVT